MIFDNSMKDTQTGMGESFLGIPYAEPSEAGGSFPREINLADGLGRQTDRLWETFSFMNSSESFPQKVFKAIGEREDRPWDRKSCRLFLFGVEDHTAWVNCLDLRGKSPRSGAHPT